MEPLRKENMILASGGDMRKTVEKEMAFELGWGREQRRGEGLKGFTERGTQTQ